MSPAVEVQILDADEPFPYHVHVEYGSRFDACTDHQKSKIQMKKVKKTDFIKTIVKN